MLTLPSSQVKYTKGQLQSLCGEPGIEQPVGKVQGDVPGLLEDLQEAIFGYQVCPQLAALPNDLTKSTDGATNDDRRSGIGTSGECPLLRCGPTK